MLTSLNLIVGPTLAFVAWFSLARTIGLMATTSRDTNPDDWLLEDVRIAKLRSGSKWFCCAEPLIQEFMATGLAGRIARPKEIGKSLSRGGDPLPWTVNEYVSTVAVQATAYALAAAIAAYYVLGAVAALLALAVISPIVFYSNVARLHSQARKRVASFRRELPYAADLLALMMEAGAEFIEALETTVEKTRATTVGEELLRVQRLMNRGESMECALDELQNRMDCEDVREVVSAIKNAQNLGAPLSQTLLEMADQMRLKRVQRAEAQVGRAQTQINFPGLVIMAACLVIVVATFMLPVIYGDGLF